MRVAAKLQQVVGISNRVSDKVSSFVFSTVVSVVDKNRARTTAALTPTLAWQARKCFVLPA